MPSVAASSPASERDERIFKAAFGIMDSSQDGEAVAAFLRVREIFQRQDRNGAKSGFRRLLERCEEAERRNAELGRQNAELRHEIAALRARTGRSLAPAPLQASRLLFPEPPASSKPEHSIIRHCTSHWDLGVAALIVTCAVRGFLGATSVFTLAAAVLICAAFTNRFSPRRFFAGALLGVAAYATAIAPARPAMPPSYTVVEAPPADAPAASATAAAPYQDDGLDVAERREPDELPPPASQAFNPPPLPRPRASADAIRQPRSRRAARNDCAYRNCARDAQRRQDVYADFE